MHRSRSLTYLVGAALAIFTLYTLLSLTKPRNVQVIHSSPDAPVPTRVAAPPPPPPPPAKSQKPIDEHQGFNANKPTQTEKEQGEEEEEDDDDDLDRTETFTRPPTPPYPKTPEKVATQKHGSLAHSIDDLIKQAEHDFQETFSHQTRTLNEAAAAYRKRRGRHPPPGFDRWYKYASQHDAIMVEEYWDQIYHDLNPFWAIAPKMLRAQARSENMAVEVKNGRSHYVSDWFWHKIWSQMIDEVADFLPDMYIGMNPMDESRLLVPWEQINEYMAKADAEKKMEDPSKVVNKVKGWGADKEADAPDIPDPKFNSYSVYRYARSACAPDSPARQVGGILPTEKIFGEYHHNGSSVDVAYYFDGRFVSNYTEASDYCTDASIGGLHGALMQPLSCSVSHVLMPMFGGSKFAANNEILLPAPMYWNEEVRFGGGGDGDQVPWDSKTSAVIWRGTATGGRSKPHSWHLFHRHRYVAMVNGTKYDVANKQSDLIFSPFFREGSIRHLHPNTQHHLSSWLASLHDVAFTNLVCDENEEDGGCWYTNDEYSMEKGIEFFEHFTHKYLPDIDGNSFSGRYRAFLLSNSLPIKATIYREWHDSRLIAWKHFVPMNNRFSDYYKIIEHFIGSKAAGLEGHDDQAKKIALDGKEWAEKVLRKVDMQIYVGRLLLEYARLTDDKRDVLGWVEDLLSSPVA